MIERRFRIFISSPGDVGREREVACKVIERVDAWFSGRMKIEGYFWEHEPMRATRGDFQQQIPEPSSFDLVVCILWSRLGSRLHPGMHMRADGSNYASGTEYEFESAVEAFQKNGSPDLLIYRRSEIPLFPPEPRSEMEARLGQWEALKNFCERWFRDEREGTFTAAFNTYKDSGEFERAFEEHLKRLVENHFTESSPVHPAIGQSQRQKWWQGSPYQGLRTFELEHEPVFFGRTRARDEVIGALRSRWVEEKCPFVLIFGASGSGKSSLMRAGVLSWLVRPGVIEGIGLWRVAILRPATNDGDLIATLTTALTSSGALPELISDGTSTEQIAGFLRDEPKTIAALIKGALSQASAVEQQADNLLTQPISRLALGIDQLEEVFTLRDRFDDADRARFFHAISTLARSGYVWIVTTLRSDFYYRCEEIPELVDLKKGRGQYHLLAPTDVELSQMIRYPAEAAGLVFEEHPTKGKLDETIIRDAFGQNGALPLLEYAMEMLYHKSIGDGVISHDEYEQIGRVAGAVTRKAEETFNALPESARAALGDVLKGLVTIGETDDSAPARKLADYESITRNEGAKTFVDSFLEARLFTIDAGDGSQRSMVNVSHESLLRVWPRVTDWITANRDFLRQRARLGQAISQWKAKEKHEDFLLSTGLPLAEAEEILTRHRSNLTTDETSFIESSQAKARRQRKLRNRTRLIAGGIAAVLILCAVAAAFLAHARSEENKREKLLTEQKRIQVEAYYQVHQAQILHAEGKFQSALKLAADAFDRSTDFTTRSAFLTGLLAAPPNLKTSITGFKGGVTLVRFSTDGTIAAADSTGIVRVIDPTRKPAVIAIFRPETAEAPLITRLSPTADGWLADREDGGRISLSKNGAIALKAAASQPGSIVAVTADQKHSAHVSPENPGEVSILSETGVLEKKETLDERIVSMAFTDDGALAIGNAKGGISLTAANSSLATFPSAAGNRLTSMAWKPGANSILAAGDAAGNIVLLNRDGTPFNGTPSGGGERVTSVAWSPDGTQLAASFADGTIRVWQPASEESLQAPQVFKGHQGAALTVSWSIDGSMLVSGGDDGTILFWMSGKDYGPLQVSRKSSPLTALAVDPQSNIVIGSSEGEVYLKSRTIASEGEEILSVDLQTSGTVAYGTRSGAIKLWQGDQPGHSFPAEPDATDPTIWRVRFSPDGRRLAASSHSGTVRVFDTISGSTSFNAKFPDYALGLAWSPDSSKIAASSTRGQIHLWDAANSKSILELPVEHSESIGSLAWHPSKEILASCGNDGTVKTWDLKTRKLISSSASVGSYLEDVAWSPDGHRLCAVGSDGHLYIWEGENLIPYLSAKIHDDHIWAVVWRKNQIYSVSDDKSSRVLDLDEELWKRRGEQITGLPLPPLEQ